MSDLTEPIQNAPQRSAPQQAVVKVGLCILPVAEIVIGALYLDDCPRQHYIPIYLVVVGVMGLLLTLLTGTDTLGVCFSTLNCITRLFFFCWFIAGNVWIYSIYEPNYNQTATDVDLYCNKTLYLFAFWTTTLSYILLLVGCCCCSN